MNTTPTNCPQRIIASGGRTARRVICTGVLAVALSSGVTSAARAESAPTASNDAATTMIVAGHDDATDAAGRPNIKLKVRLKLGIRVRPTGG